MHRDFLSIPDFSRAELDRLFDLAESMRSGAYTKKPLAGKSLAMIFLKSSTRTRVSFEVGTWQLGGHALFLSSRDVQIGRGEPIPDTARVLSRYVDGIMIRTFAHSDVEQLAQHSRVPGDQRAHGSPPSVPGARRHPHRSPATRNVRGEEGRVDRRRQQHGELVDQRRVPARIRARRLHARRATIPDPAILARAQREANVTFVRDPNEAAARRARREHRRLGVDGPGSRSSRSARRRSPASRSMRR